MTHRLTLTATAVFGTSPIAARLTVKKTFTIQNGRLFYGRTAPQRPYPISPLVPGFWHGLVAGACTSRHSHFHNNACACVKVSIRPSASAISPSSPVIAWISARNFANRSWS